MKLNKRVKNVSIVLFSFFLSFFYASYEFSDKSEAKENMISLKSQPEVTVQNSDNKECAFTVSIPKASFYGVATEKDGRFSRYITAGALRGGTAYLSQPETPVFTVYLALPVGEKGGARVAVEHDDGTLHKAIRLMPIQKPRRDSEDQKDDEAFEYNEKIYLNSPVKSGVHSFEPVDKGANKVPDKANIYKLSLNLVDYEPMKEQLVTYSSFRIKVSFTGDTRYFYVKRKTEESGYGEMDAVDQWMEDQYSVMERAVLNRNVIENERYTLFRKFRPVFFGTRLIIVTHKEFKASAEKLKAHKISRGISTSVKVVDSNNTKEEIKKYLEDAYSYSWFVRPKWVLFIGDSEFIPTHYSGINTWDSVENSGDIYYGQFTGDDTTVPVFGIGRLPVDTNDQALSIVDKIIAYETNPPLWGVLHDNPYYYNLAFASYFQDTDYWNPTPDGIAVRWFIETSEHIRDYLIKKHMSVERIYYAPEEIDPWFYEDGTPIPADLRKPGFAWDGDKSDIIDAVNDGVSILYHRDHGWWNGWGDPSFHTWDLAGISVSNNQFPVVYSINCASGIFDNETDAGAYGTSATSVYFAETFLRKPDGAIGVIGDSRSSDTILNNYMAKGLFDAVFPDYLEGGGPTSDRKLGDGLNHAKVYLKTAPYGSSDLKQELLIYNLLGDPTVEVRARGRFRLIIPPIIWRERQIIVPVFFEEMPEVIAGPIMVVALAENEKMEQYVVGRTLITAEEIRKEMNITVPVTINTYEDPVKIVLSGPQMITMEKSVER